MGHDKESGKSRLDEFLDQYKVSYYLANSLLYAPWRMLCLLTGVQVREGLVEIEDARPLSDLFLGFEETVATKILKSGQDLDSVAESINDKMALLHRCAFLPVRLRVEKQEAPGPATYWNRVWLKILG
jgi:hypothetical protein